MATHKPKKLLNPRGYLSWTQVDMWLKSPDRYIRQYIHGGSGFENSGMTYGKSVSDALDGGEAMDGAMEALVSLLPHYSKREHQLEAVLVTSKGQVVLLGKLDTFDPDVPCFREYKTGRVKWTLAKAKKHKQILHYATLVYLFHGKLPTKAWLDWAETEEIDGEVRLTGRIESFDVTPTLKEVLEYMALAGRVAQEIDEAYRAEMLKLV
jgi:hypothetical protein